MTSFLEKVASVLDAVADDIDNNTYASATPSSDEQAAASSDELEIAKLASAYVQVTGEEPSEDVLAQLQSNPTFKSTILKGASQIPYADPLGGPSDKTAGYAPETPLRGEAAIEAARNNYAQSILSLANRSE